MSERKPPKPTRPLRQRILVLRNGEVTLNKQIKELQSKTPVLLLEPVKKVFLDASRARKEFLQGDDSKKRNILENLCWNLSIKNKTVAQVKLKSPYDVLFKAPKTGSISMLLGEKESDLHCRIQSPASYH